MFYIFSYFRKVNIDIYKYTNIKNTLIHGYKQITFEQIIYLQVNLIQSAVRYPSTALELVAAIGMRWRMELAEVFHISVLFCCLFFWSSVLFRREAAAFTLMPFYHSASSSVCTLLTMTLPLGLGPARQASRAPSGLVVRLC